ncbi:MAG TPA: fructosamine kinase family protein [Gammaproteobacteria bacterium]|nr:fructosamine kinase family protein [Gammaproteobacteria bacterium]
MHEADWRIRVEQALGAGPGREASWRPLGDGVGGERWQVRVDGTQGFVKSGSEGVELFEAEADGLRALSAARAVRVPAVRQLFRDGATACLLLEWLPLTNKSSAAGARLGEQLARQHLAYGQRFGWARSNFIGATPQFNTPGDDWPRFFVEQRLKFQLRLAAENGCRGELQAQGAALVESVPRFFAGYTARPSLLHGDLWGGNWGALPDGEPVLFDPAVYHGDREADLAMTELFGGFPAEFYAAYRAHAPLDAGYQVRRELYNLYHVLNHFNLFGGGYAEQAMAVIRHLLAEIR